MFGSISFFSSIFAVALWTAKAPSVWFYAIYIEWLVQLDIGKKNPIHRLLSRFFTAWMCTYCFRFHNRFDANRGTSWNSVCVCAQVKKSILFISIRARWLLLVFPLLDGCVFDFTKKASKTKAKREKEKINMCFIFRVRFFWFFYNHNKNAFI